MDSTVIAAIIAAIATIVVVIIQGRNSKKNSSSEALEKNSTEFLKGTWNCEWLYKEGTKLSKGAADDMPEVTIYKVADNKILGKGLDGNIIPDFTMEGTISGKAIVLDGFRGGQKGGEVRLFIADNKYKLEGTWEWRDTPGDRAYGGKTIWTKA